MGSPAFRKQTWEKADAVNARRIVVEFSPATLTPSKIITKAAMTMHQGVAANRRSTTPCYTFGIANEAKIPLSMMILTASVRACPSLPISNRRKICRNRAMRAGAHLLSSQRCLKAGLLRGGRHHRTGSTLAEKQTSHEEPSQERRPQAHAL